MKGGVHMDMTGYLGKKVDLTCKDGRKISGHVFDVLSAEESDVGEDCVDIVPLDRMNIVEIAIGDITKVKEDTFFRQYDFRK